MNGIASLYIVVSVLLQKQAASFHFVNDKAYWVELAIFAFLVTGWDIAVCLFHGF